MKPKKQGRPQSYEAVAISTGAEGSIFYSTNEDKVIQSKASNLGVKVRTKQGQFTPSFGEDKEPINVTQVTVVGKVIKV